MPARQRGTVLDDVAGGPQDAALIQRTRHVVVRTQDVEVSCRDSLQHEVDRLFRCPGGGRLLGAAIGGERSEDEAGNEEMRRHLAIRRVAQLMLKRFSERLHTGLGDVVGRIARRRGDALLRAGVDDQCWPAARNHIRREHLRAVDDAPQVHVDDPRPALMRAEDGASGLNTRVVHQHIGAAEPGPHRLLQLATLSRLLTSMVAVMIAAAPRLAIDDNCVAASFSLPASTSAMHTFRPMLAKRVAAARPMPEAPPVMTAVWSGERAGWATMRTPGGCGRDVVHDYPRARG